MLSQSTLAEAADISISAIGAYEQGVHASPHRDTVGRIAETLGLTGTDLEEFVLSARRKPRGARASSGRRSNDALPLQPTSFFGREAETARIEQLLRQHRIVTIVGVGGVGKTRLALHVAERLKREYTDDVRFVDFSSLTDARGLEQKVAAAIGSPTLRSPDYDELLASTEERAMLLLFDNCEHVLEEIATMSAAMVRKTPHVRILATSRERLRIAGEVVFRLPPLALPAANVTDAEETARCPSVALFIDRARAVRTDFSVAGSRLAPVVKICRLLEGVPLALELAAAHLATLPLQSLGDHLTSCLSGMAAGYRDLPERQRTLSATLQWSYDLLHDDERVIFRRLGIFAGEWTSQAAAAVCAQDPVDDGAVLATLSSLVDKSLIALDPRSDDVRYSMLQLLRAFALDRLAESGEQQIVERRHASWFATLADEAFQTSETHQAWYATYAPELENLRVALAWATGPHGDLALAARILRGFAQVWLDGGRSSEFWALLESVLSGFDACSEPVLHGHLRLRLAALGTDVAQRIDIANGVLNLAEAFAEPHLSALAWEQIALAHFWNHDTSPAETAFKKAIALMEELGYRRRVTLLYIYLCYSLLTNGNAIEASRYFEAAVDTAATLQEDLAVGFAQCNLAALEVAMGRLEQARERYGTSIAAARKIGARRLEMMALCERAATNVLRRHFEDASSDAIEALSMAKRLKAEPPAVQSVEILAAVGAARGELRRAAQLKGFADARMRALNR
ncbi:MAG: helix-turn-helix domain-containing protein, partial [Candidatus Eremiobacteraeota bacterium]|nr:helix-turn-helix domain-containing protein [Candidatus Eremiobacteraeota bacterium]